MACSTLPLPTWTQDPNICRCCLSISSNKELMAEYYFCGQKEVYQDMLLEAFNIKINPTLIQGSNGRICDLCIQMLRDAYSFKHMVWNSVKTVSEYFSQIAAEPHVEVKIEPSDPPEIITADSAPLSEVSKREDNPLGIAKVKLEPDEEITGIDAAMQNEDEYLVHSQTKPGIDVSIVKEEFIVEFTPENSHAKVSGGTDDEQDDDSDDDEEDLIPLSECVKRKAAPPAKRKRREETEIATEKQGENTMEPICRLTPDQNGIEGNLYKCGKCEEKFELMSNLVRHLSTKHPYRLYSCPYCNELFPKRLALLRHKLEVHNICDRNKRISMKKKAPSKWSRHKQDKKMKCESCNFETIHSDVLERHMVRHADGKGFLCKFCNKHILNERNLIIHEQTHTGEKTKLCTECGQMFFHTGSLRYHLQKYHPEVAIQKRVRRKTKYIDNKTCTICGQVFHHRGSLTYHRKKHHPEESFN